MSDQYLEAAWARGKEIFCKAERRESPYFGPGEPLEKLGELCQNLTDPQQVMDWLDFKLPGVKIPLPDKVALHDLWQLMMMLLRGVMIRDWLESGECVWLPKRKVRDD
jgi:hypothetical protein